MAALYIPQVGDSYVVLARGWQHKRGETVVVSKIDGKKIYLAQAGQDRPLWIGQEAFNTDNLRYTNTNPDDELTVEEIAIARDGLAEILGIKSP